MKMQDKLAIFLVTYNRMEKLQQTLKSILAKQSPVKDVEITILDNASTDGTSEMLDKYIKKFPNLRHIRHKINIGGDANICRAYELGAGSGKDYVWVLCDDDKYDFSNWKEVEQAIKDNNDIICLADYIFPTQETKTDPAYQIFQLTFVPAGIYKTSLITDTVLTNMYNATYTCFQQSCITINAINKQKKIHVLSEPVVFNGIHYEDKVEDVSLIRGSYSSDVLPRRLDTRWILGYINILGLLKDEKLRYRCLEVAIPYEDIYSSWDNFYHYLKIEYLNTRKINYFFEIYRELPVKNKQEFLSVSANDISNVFTDLFPNIARGFARKNKKISLRRIIDTLCSVKNSESKRHKIITFLGMKLKLPRRQFGIDDIEIFVTTHNRADLIEASLDSLLAQTAGVKQIIVLDNESTDNTEEVVKKYSGKHDNIVKYVRTYGHLGNYKYVKKNASKAYCMMFHDDDILHPEYLNYVLNALNRNTDVGLVVSRYTEFKTRKPKIVPVSDKVYKFNKQNEFARHMYFVENIAYATAIYKTKYFKKEDVEYQKFNKFNDWPLMCKMSRYGRTILFDDKGLYYVRRHKGQDTWTQQNTPSVQQIINWDKFFYDIFKEFNDKEALKMFPNKAKYFLYGKYKSFLSTDNRKKYTFADILKAAKKSGLPVTETPQFDLNGMEYMDYVQSLLRQFASNSRFKFNWDIVFSIKNSHDKKHKIISILGLHIKLNRSHIKQLKQKMKKLVMLNNGQNSGGG